MEIADWMWNESNRDTAGRHSVFVITVRLKGKPLDSFGLIGGLAVLQEDIMIMFGEGMKTVAPDLNSELSVDQYFT